MGWWRRLTRAVTTPVVLEFPSDARTLPVAPPRDGRPESRRRVRRRRRAKILAVATLIVAGLVAVLVGEGGLVDLQHQRQEVRIERARLQAQAERVAALEAEVARLRDEPAARERLARERLGRVRPEEIDFLLPRTAGAP